MSVEKMEFILPINFTIGVGNGEDLVLKFAKFCLDNGDSEDENRVEQLVKGIIEGETRV
jgi:hypothetical protein